MSPESQIPVGSQFSPSLISLPHLTTALLAHAGDRNALISAINAPPVRLGSRVPKTKRNRSLPLEAAIQYGLLAGTSLQPTDLTKSLAGLDPKAQSHAFAKHILLNCGGLRVIQGAEEMLSEGKKITGDTLARHLTAQGFFVAEHNTAINTLRMWLAEARIFSDSGRGPAAWTPHRAAIEHLIGLDASAISDLASLDSEQHAFVMALARRRPAIGEWIPAADVRDAAEAVAGVRIARGSLPNAVLKPLHAIGLIDFRTGGTARGKTSELSITKKFDSDVLVPFLERACKSLDPSLTDYFRRRPEDIRTALESTNTNVAGKALEAFAIQVMRTLGLTFESWQRRAVGTGWGEVDVLLSGIIACLPTRWQVQCKNTKATVSHETIAREVGLVSHTRATHILVMSRGKYSTNAHNYVLTTMRAESIPIYLIDGPAFDRILAEPAALASEIKRQSERILEALRKP
jgi:hypothetical protein